MKLEPPGPSEVPFKITFEVTEVAGFAPRKPEPGGCELCGHCRVLRQRLAQRAPHRPVAGDPAAPGDRP